MIDVMNEELLALSAAAKVTPGRPHVSTLWRWHQRGIKGIRLETAIVGGRRFTTRGAIEQFIAATTAAANGEAPPVRTPRQRQRAIDAAERELAKAGI